MDRIFEIHFAIFHLTAGPNYLGCYHLTDLGSSSVLAKTTEDCLAKCEEAGKKYAIRGGERCYCRSSSDISLPTTPEEDSACDRMCSGTVNEPCGGMEPSTYTVYDCKTSSDFLK